MDFLTFFHPPAASLRIHISTVAPIKKDRSMPRTALLDFLRNGGLSVPFSAGFLGNKKTEGRRI